MDSQTSLVCDTIPAPRLADTEYPISMAFEPDAVFDTNPDSPMPNQDQRTPIATEPRKLCPRHQRMADEGTNIRLQQVSTFTLVVVCINISHKVTRNATSGRKGGSQRPLVKFFFVLASETGTYPAGPPNNVLLLSIVPHL